MRIGLASLLLWGCASGPSDTYPAFPPDGMPLVVNGGGLVLANPKIVTVTWDADPNAAVYEAFGDAMGASSYWSTTTSAYGVGPASSGVANHVRVAAAPVATMTDDEIAQFVEASVDGGLWPANDAQTIYVVYVPEATAVTSNGADICQSLDAYHDELSTVANPHILYAVIFEACRGSQDVVTSSTESASHEMIEAATDPRAETDVAWDGVDLDHMAWTVWLGAAELGDMCEYTLDSYYREPSLANAWVQRTWSNALARTGHNPCVPTVSTPYFNVTPLDVDSISVSGFTTKGYAINFGQTRTIHLGLFSDALTTPFFVGVTEGDGFSTQAEQFLHVTTKGSPGQNGQIVDVDITVVTLAPDGVLVTATSTLDGTAHYMPFLITTK